MDTSIARRADGQLIYAEQGIDKSLPFNCPGCKQEVYAATEGKVQRPHFRHKSINGSKGCSEPESYIHWITKELFADFFKSIDSLYIEIPYYLYCTASKTCKKKSTYQLDLKEKFPYILVEEYHQGFRPDCMLYNDIGEKLYLEVKYTHAVSEEKIDTGMPIIELNISNEKDIDKIIACRKISTDIIPYKIHNSTSLLPNKLTFDCEGECLQKFNNKESANIIYRKSRYSNENTKEQSYWRSIDRGFPKGSNNVKQNISVSSIIKKLNQSLEKNKCNDKKEPKKNSIPSQKSFDF